ncbi:hypothetical protein GALMADRAFT_1209671 [Galerina marginata CBS 339.88]|uniref:Uncharacterized protein n=1 Tax=Galerina marginata (strain CBS 339.88) TaxID=685588 RepID=A0A067S5M0_GALM3|nr:hypothetical protein GALMADRAFT_1209671 [Galerina marginata CBS 339.88]
MKTTRITKDECNHRYSSRLVFAASSWAGRVGLSHRLQSHHRHKLPLHVEVQRRHHAKNPCRPGLDATGNVRLWNTDMTKSLRINVGASRTKEVKMQAVVLTEVSAAAGDFGNPSAGLPTVNHAAVYYYQDSGVSWTSPWRVETIEVSVDPDTGRESRDSGWVRA